MYAWRIWRAAWLREGDDSHKPSSSLAPLGRQRHDLLCRCAWMPGAAHERERGRRRAENRKYKYFRKLHYISQFTRMKQNLIKILLKFNKRKFFFCSDLFRRNEEPQEAVSWEFGRLVVIIAGCKGQTLITQFIKRKS